MKKEYEFYYCPECNNLIVSEKEIEVSCCGKKLDSLELKDCNERHQILADKVEDEYFVHMNHPMTKEHFMPYLAAVREDGVEIKKFYPEENCETRFKMSKVQGIVAVCNLHGGFLLNM
jgi:desulfoferrodoxin (superoxide reductase-like protein)